MRKIQQILLMLLLFVSTHSFSQTGVRVTYYDGSIQSFMVGVAGKLYFSADNLLVKSDGTVTPTTIPVSIIRKITFFDTTAALGVHLISLKAATTNCSATVNWESGIEENFSYYELQYGPSSNSFTHILKVESKGSNSKYAVDLSDLKGLIYYRLKMVDKDGKTAYSAILSTQLTCLASDAVSVYPNPTTGIIKIKSNNTNTVTIKIFSPVGQLVKQGSYQGGEDISVSELAAGLYLVQINGSSMIKLIKK